MVLDESKKGMEGMEIGRVLLFFSFQYRRQNFSRVLINWFVHDDGLCRWSVIGMDKRPLKLSILIPLLEEFIYCLFMVLHGFPMTLVITTH